MPEAAVAPISFSSLSRRAAPPLGGEDEDVNVLREPFHDAVGLREARSAFENEVVSEPACQLEENLADPVVLLDCGGADFQPFRGCVERRSELVGVAEQGHCSAGEREVAANRLASRRPNRDGGRRSSERGEKMSKPLADTRWLGCRGANKAVDAKRPGVDEAPDPIHGVGGLDECIPVAEYFEQRDLHRTEPLVAALRAGGAADDVDGARVARGSPGNGDRLPAWHLCR